MIKEDLLEINLLDYYNENKFKKYDILKILGGSKRPTSYFVCGKVYPLNNRPNLFGTIIKVKRKRSVVNLGTPKFSRYRYIRGKGWFLDADFSGIKTFLVMRQIDMDTNKILFDRNQRAELYPDICHSLRGDK